jgi:hypothetical protein
MVDDMTVTITDLVKKHRSKPVYHGFYSIRKHI